MISLDAVRNQTSNGKCLLELSKKQIKSSSNKYVRDAREVLTNEDHFPKIISQYGFLSTKLPRLFVVCDISPSSFKLKRGILPSLRDPTCLDKISSVI